MDAPGFQPWMVVGDFKTQAVGLGWYAFGPLALLRLRLSYRAVGPLRLPVSYRVVGPLQIAEYNVAGYESLVRCFAIGVCAVLSALDGWGNFKTQAVGLGWYAFGPLAILRLRVSYRAVGPFEIAGFFWAFGPYEIAGYELSVRCFENWPGFQGFAL